MSSEGIPSASPLLADLSRFSENDCYNDSYLMLTFWSCSVVSIVTGSQRRDNLSPDSLNLFLHSKLHQFLVCGDAADMFSSYMHASSMK